MKVNFKKKKKTLPRTRTPVTVLRPAMGPTEPTPVCVYTLRNKGLHLGAEICTVVN